MIGSLAGLLLCVFSNYRTLHCEVDEIQRGRICKNGMLGADVAANTNELLLLILTDSSREVENSNASL